MNDSAGPLRARFGCCAVLLAAAAASSLSGCADLRRSASLPPVNRESPVAPQVAAAARRQHDVPRLMDVPPPPKDVPTAAEVKVGVVSMVRCRGGVESFAVTHPQFASGTASFAADLREAAQVNPADVPPPDSAERSESEAAELRAFASPPAAIASGPAPTPADAQPPAPAPAPPPNARPGRPTGHPAVAAASAPAAPVQAPPSPPVAAPLQAVAPPPPPLPAPLPDPLLARCS